MLYKWRSLAQLLLLLTFGFTLIQMVPTGDGEQRITSEESTLRRRITTATNSDRAASDTVSTVNASPEDNDDDLSFSLSAVRDQWDQLIVARQIEKKWRNQHIALFLIMAYAVLSILGISLSHMVFLQGLASSNNISSVDEEILRLIPWGLILVLFPWVSVMVWNCDHISQPLPPNKKYRISAIGETARRCMMCHATTSSTVTAQMASRGPFGCIECPRNREHILCIECAYNGRGFDKCLADQTSFRTDGRLRFSADEIERND